MFDKVDQFFDRRGGDPVVPSDKRMHGRQRQERRSQGRQRRYGACVAGAALACRRWGSIGLACSCRRRLIGHARSYGRTAFGARPPNPTGGERARPSPVGACCAELGRDEGREPRR